MQVHNNNYNYIRASLLVTIQYSYRQYNIIFQVRFRRPKRLLYVCEVMTF